MRGRTHGDRQDDLRIPIYASGSPAVIELVLVVRAVPPDRRAAGGTPMSRGASKDPQEKPRRSGVPVGFSIRVQSKLMRP